MDWIKSRHIISLPLFNFNLSTCRSRLPRQGRGYTAPIFLLLKKQINFNFQAASFMLKSDTILWRNMI
jgi:hypothetical protein